MIPLNKSDLWHYNAQNYPSKTEKKSEFKSGKTYFTCLSIMAVSNVRSSAQKYVLHKTHSKVRSSAQNYVLHKTQLSNTAKHQDYILE